MVTLSREEIFEIFKSSIESYLSMLLSVTLGWDNSLFTIIERGYVTSCANGMQFSIRDLVTPAKRVFGMKMSLNDVLNKYTNNCAFCLSNYWLTLT